MAYSVYACARIVRLLVPRGIERARGSHLAEQRELKIVFWRDDVSKIIKILNSGGKKKSKSPSPMETVSLSLLYLVRTPCVRAVAVGTPLKNVRSCVRAPRDNQVGRDSTRKAKGLSTIYFLKKEKILPSQPPSTPSLQQLPTPACEGKLVLERRCVVDYVLFLLT